MIKVYNLGGTLFYIPEQPATETETSPQERYEENEEQERMDVWCSLQADLQQQNLQS